MPGWPARGEKAPNFWDDRVREYIDAGIKDTGWIDASAELTSDWVGELWLRRTGPRVTMRIGINPSPTLDGTPKTPTSTPIVYVLPDGYVPPIVGSTGGNHVGTASDSALHLFEIELTGGGAYASPTSTVTGNWDQDNDFFFGEYTWLTDDDFPD